MKIKQFFASAVAIVGVVFAGVVGGAGLVSDSVQATVCLYFPPDTTADFNRAQRALDMLGSNDRVTVEDDPLIGEGSVIIERHDGVVIFRGPNNPRCDGYEIPPIAPSV